MGNTLRVILGLTLAAVVLVCIGILAARHFRPASATDAGETSLGRWDIVLPRQAVVYSFHGAIRCQACRQLEEYSRQLVRRDFADALADGRLRWQAIDFDQPANRHFVEEFGILASTLVVVELRDGKPAAAKNLQKSLQLADDRPALENLLTGAIRTALEAP